MKLVDVDELLSEGYECVAEFDNWGEVENCEDLEEIPTVDAIVIPEGATNGEMMYAMFPDIEMWGESKDTLDYSLGGMIHRVTKSWWNAPYKKGE